MEHIYTDGIHLVTTGELAQLHEFAKRIGLKRSWFQPTPPHTYPHYDILSTATRARALRSGAVLVTSRELIRLLQSIKQIQRSKEDNV